MRKQQALLCFLVRDDEILLAESDYRLDKKTWNGITGFVTDTRQLELDAVKIIFDAIKVQVYAHDLEQAGVMHLYTLNADKTLEETLIITIFLCEKWLGEPRLTGNFRPRWFSLDTIPYQDMFEDTKDWLPKIIAGEKVIIEILSEYDKLTNAAKINHVTVKNIFE